MHPDAQLLRRASRSPEELLSHVPHAEAFLAVSVILQAFSDTGWMTGSDTPQHGNSVDRDQARMFLLSTRGDWAAAREAWAVAANLDPDYVREIALKLSKTTRPPRQNQGRTSRPPKQDVVERVRERVECLRSQGVDITTASPSEVGRILNTAGLTTPSGQKYDSTFAGYLRDLFLRCVKWGALSHE
jgi:hypothetical protein